jgi:hypothetical protein
MRRQVNKREVLFARSPRLSPYSVGHNLIKIDHPKLIRQATIKPDKANRLRQCSKVTVDMSAGQNTEQAIVFDKNPASLCGRRFPCLSETNGEVAHPFCGGIGNCFFFAHKNLRFSLWNN